jgi:hypothetical protein
MSADPRAGAMSAETESLTAGRELDAVAAADIRWLRHEEARERTQSRDFATRDHRYAVECHHAAERYARILGALADTARLDWWEQHLNYEHGRNIDPADPDGSVDMYRVSGNINDREWEPVGTFDTLRQSIDAAIRYEGQVALGVAQLISGALADGFTSAFSGDDNEQERGRSPRNP